MATGPPLSVGGGDRLTHRADTSAQAIACVRTAFAAESAGAIMSMAQVFKHEWISFLSTIDSFFSSICTQGMICKHKTLLPE